MINILLINVKMPTTVDVLTFISMINILLINVKMPTTVGILTFISMMHTTSERLKARNFFICQYFSLLEIWCSVEHEKSFITPLGPG